MDYRKRSLAKTVSWRAVGTVLTVLFVYIWLGEWATSVAMGVSVNAVKAVAYYIHERGWNLIRWGQAEK